MVRGSRGKCVCMQVHARVPLCTCLLRAVPQTEVRRAPEQVQIELNLIPHCYNRDGIAQLHFNGGSNSPPPWLFLPVLPSS